MRLTGRGPRVSAPAVKRPSVVLDPAQPLTVGSFGNAAALLQCKADEVRAACDLAEIRLDLLEAGGVACSARPWASLESVPLLFTARRAEEGGAGPFDTSNRRRMLESALADASLVDIELASAAELRDLPGNAGVPWVASWHDFEGRPDSFDRLPDLARRAHDEGAACFKAAIRLHRPSDLARLGEFLSSPSPLPLSVMGMGPLAPVSRLLAAQCGSVLNYGFLGEVPSAPGQWTARRLREGIAALESVVSR